MLNLHEIKNKLKGQQELYMRLFNEDDLNVRDNIKQEITEKTINGNDLVEYEKSILKEAQEFNISVDNNFDVYDWKPITPTLAHFIKHRAHWLVVNKEWCEKLYNKLTEKSKPINKDIDYWIKSIEDGINSRYNPLMKICQNKIGFQSEKEILLNDLKLKLEYLYFPYVKSDKLFTSKSLNCNESEQNLTRKEGGQIKNDSSTIPFKNDTFETIGQVGNEPNNYQVYLSTLTADNVITDRNLETRDENFNKNVNSAETFHLDTNKINFINNLLNEFKYERIKKLDKFFYLSSFF